MHGYQLKKRLADTLGSFWVVSYGSLYPTLKRLLREGAVEMVFPKEQVGRRKNVYRITEQGEALFAELLERAGQDASEDSGFRVRLAFFQYLTGDISGGDQSRDKALSLASKSQKKQLSTQLAQARKQGLQVQKQLKKAKQQQQSGSTTTPGANPLQNPFGGLGSSTGTTP